MLLTQLPDDYEELAYKRIEEYPSGKNAPRLTSDFLFHHTPEGKDFWWAVNDAITESELPEIPDTDE